MKKILVLSIMVFAMACSPRLKNTQKPAPTPQKEVADTPPPPPPPEPPRTNTPPPPPAPPVANDSPAPTAPPKSVSPKAGSADIAEGKSLYAANCEKCHKLVAPSDLTETQWNRIIPPMAKKAKIDEATQLKITAFLLSEAKK